MSLQNLLKHSVDVKIIDDYLQTLAQKQIELNQTNSELNRNLNSVKNSLLESEEENKRLELSRASLDANLKLKERERINEIEKNKQLEIEKADLRKAVKARAKPKIIKQFIAFDDGTAFDTKTGLTWCRYSVGQQWINGVVTGEATKMYVNDAIRHIKDVNKNELLGWSDWRLPTVDELQKIVANVDVTIKWTSPENVFPNTPNYWFLSTNVDGVHKLIRFGFEEYKQDDFYVRR
jgi:hypothetical protein